MKRNNLHNNENFELIHYIDERILDLNKRLNNIYDLAEQGLYDKSVFTERCNSLKANIINLQQEKDRISDYENDITNNEISESITISQLYRSLSPALKNKLLKELFSKIIYDKSQSCRWNKAIYPQFTLEIICNID